jgi:DivIVA domain-containing protein
VALDRQSIEKKDFPVGRRGYDPEAVDSHLTALADEVADLKRTARRRSDTLASSASEQVRAIVEAAENSAADIQRDAENDAREIRDEANKEAESTRDQALEQAREYVGKVSESTSSMLERLGAMEGELGALIESLRTITGLSGSGKSSLAFDTIYAEGQRRYVESLSSYARQFLGQMEKPDVDYIEGLSPAISIDQKSTSRNPRSTVGTVTEIYDYLRCSSRASASRTATSAAARSARNRASRSSIRSWSCPRARASNCSRR